jgi:hypothetical protein
MPCHPPIVHSKKQGNWKENEPFQQFLIIFAMFVPISFLVCSQTGTSPMYMPKKAPAN